MKKVTHIFFLKTLRKAQQQKFNNIPKAWPGYGWQGYSFSHFNWGVKIRALLGLGSHFQDFHPPRGQHWQILEACQPVYMIFLESDPTHLEDKVIF